MRLLNSMLRRFVRCGRLRIIDIHGKVHVHQGDPGSATLRVAGAPEVRVVLTLSAPTPTATRLVFAAALEEDPAPPVSVERLLHGLHRTRPASRDRHGHPGVNDGVAQWQNRKCITFSHESSLGRFPS